MGEVITGGEQISDEHHAIHVHTILTDTGTDMRMAQLDYTASQSRYIDKASCLFAVTSESEKNWDGQKIQIFCYPISKM